MIFLLVSLLSDHGYETILHKCHSCMQVGGFADKESPGG